MICLVSIYRATALSINSSVFVKLLNIPGKSQQMSKINLEILLLRLMVLRLSLILSWANCSERFVKKRPLNASKNLYEHNFK